MTTASTANVASTASVSESTDTDDSLETIPVLRGQIDALDAAIINLVAERIRLSKRIQTARINGGGARVELGRERLILDAYRSALGRSGAHLADAVLEVCRGQR
jgi:chorismate mutase